MLEENLVCWRCGAALADEPLPLARAAACVACRADLHVCKMCEFYATGIANDCREPIAERVVNKERANFCGYHKPKPGAFNAASGAATAARAALDSLFGGAGVAPAGAAPSQAALEALFRKHD